MIKTGSDEQKQYLYITVLVPLITAVFALEHYTFN